MRESRNLIPALALAALLLTATAWAAPADRTVHSADGVPIHYTIAGQGSPALVFVHGWCCDAGYWKEQMDHFQAGHTVVAVDLAGHGSSGLGREQWTMAAFGQDVLAVVEKEDLKQVILIGHSMGGAVIAEAALAMPDRVAGLVGVDNFQQLAIGLDQAQIEATVGWLKADFPGNVRVFVAQMFGPDADPALKESVTGDMAAAPPAVGLGAMAKLLQWYKTRPAKVLPRLPAPLRCINSDRAPTDSSGIRTVRPDYGVRIMSGGHFLFLENPAVFDSLLEATLQEFAGPEEKP